MGNCALDVRVDTIAINAILQTVDQGVVTAGDDMSHSGCAEQFSLLMLAFVRVSKFHIQKRVDDPIRPCLLGHNRQAVRVRKRADDMALILRVDYKYPFHLRCIDMKTSSFANKG